MSEHPPNRQLCKSIALWSLTLSFDSISLNYTDEYTNAEGREPFE